MKDELKSAEDAPAGPAGSEFIHHPSSFILPKVLHTIRLRGAWVPAPDGTHSRKFGWPTALDPHERVWLVCESLPADAAVSVNGVAVAATADITPLLAPRNDLVVRIPPGAELGPVSLKVRTPDTSASMGAENAPPAAPGPAA